MFVAVMLLGAACSDSTEKAAPNAPRETEDSEPVEVSAPPGFRIHRGEEYGFVFPSDWTPVPGGGTFVPGADMEIVGPKGDLGLPPLITLYREEGFKGDFQRYLFTFNGEASVALPNRTVIRDEQVSVPQSVEARVIECEYTLPDLIAPEPETDKKAKTKKGMKKEEGDEELGDADTAEGSDASGEPEEAPGIVTIRQVDILVLTRDDVTINLRAAAPADEFDEFSEIFTTVLNSLRVRPPSVGDA